jgi:arginine deiminase
MVQVTSEIGRLRRVLLHEPGAEIDRMPPAMMEQLLFDDILYGDRARDEHARFRRVLQLLGIEAVEANDLVQESLERAEARAWILGTLARELGLDPGRVDGLGAAELTELLVCGSPARAEPEGVEVGDLYEIPPLANWCFQRDPQVVLGDGVILSRMATPARHRESLLARLSFFFHPELRGTRVWLDPLQDDPDSAAFVDPRGPTIEGGDVLVLSPELIVVGESERTGRSAIASLARALARRDGAPRWLITVTIPRRRAYMHLDTLVTPIDRDACLIYAPVLLDDGPESARIGEIDLHADDPRRRPSGPLLETLAARGIALEPVLCGGGDPVSQQREQWTDGANALAIAPGVITIYDRNARTAEELDRNGFRVVAATDLLLGRAEVDLDERGRVCILLDSHEMSRARGGPHCLAHPLEREAAGS